MADEGDVNLGIKVTSTADLGGVKEAQEGVSGLKGTLGETATELRHLTGSSREGEEILRGLGAAGRGGAAGIGEMVRGLRSLALVATHIMGEGPLGVLLIGLGLIGGAFLALRGHTDEAATGIEKTGTAAEKAAKQMEAIKKAVDESFKPLEDELKLINEQYAILKTRMSDAEQAASKLESSQLKLAEANARLQEAHDIEGADGDPKKIEYIKSQFEATMALIKAQQELNTSGNDLLKAQKELGALQDEAEKKAAVVAESDKLVSAARDDQAEKTRLASIAVKNFEDAQAHLAETESAANLKKQEFMQHPLGTEGGPLLMPQIVRMEAIAGVAADEVRNAAATKDAATAAASAAAVKTRQAEADAARVAADKGKTDAAVATAGQRVSDLAASAENDTRAAQANVATATIDKRIADKVTVDTGTPPIEKEEASQEDALAKSATAEMIQQARQNDAEAKAAKSADKAEAKEEKAADKAEAKQKEEVDKSEDKEDKAAAHEKKQHDKEILEELKKHTAALHHIASNTGAKKEKERGPSGVAVHAAVRGERTERRMVNALSDTSP